MPMEQFVFDTVPGVPGLISPADGGTGVPIQPTFSWAASTQGGTYTIEVDDDPGFGSINFTKVVSGTSTELDGVLDPSTTYYWRVTSENACGIGSTSSTFSFTTAEELCITPNTAIPDNNPAGATVTINVATSKLLGGMRVKLASGHTYPGDLIATLSHGGDTVTLMDRPGVPASQFGCDQPGVDVIFDDSSQIEVETHCNGTSPGIGPVVKPEEPIWAAFGGLDMMGDWDLNVSDNAGQDTGSITEFCLFPIENDIFAGSFDDSP